MLVRIYPDSSDPSLQSYVLAASDTGEGFYECRYNLINKLFILLKISINFEYLVGIASLFKFTLKISF